MSAKLLAAIFAALAFLAAPAALADTASDAKALFKHRMHMLPGEIGREGSIGTSTLFAAWNAATYNAQIEDHRLSEAMVGDAYLKATEDVLKKHGGLWFWDESFVVARRPES